MLVLHSVKSCHRAFHFIQKERRYYISLRHEWTRRLAPSASQTEAMYFGSLCTNKKSIFERLESSQQNTRIDRAM